MEGTPILNAHNKEEFPPAHTADGIGSSSIAIYTDEDNSVQLEVKLEQDTVWLSTEQMSVLFGRDRTVIGRHIQKIFSEGELEESLVCAKNAHTKKHGRREGFTQRTETKLYNLDVIISVGYRIKSIQGTRFRQWANKVLKEHIIKGYTVNQKITQQRYKELRSVVQLMSRTYNLQEQISTDESQGLIKVIANYVYALDTLDRYDYQQLAIRNITTEESFHATYENAMEAIHILRDKFSGNSLFANEKDGSFKSSIRQIYQTFDGKELYPSVEEKAAMLLYLVTKNHSFSDGNKRIAAMLFLWFMENNNILYGDNGQKRIADNTLVALTLMIAESRPEEKESIIKVIVNLINQDNQ